MKIGSSGKTLPTTTITRGGSKEPRSRDRLKTWLIRTGNDRSSDPMNRNSFFLSSTQCLSGRLIDSVGTIRCDFNYEDRLIKITVGASLAGAHFLFNYAFYSEIHRNHWYSPLCPLNEWCSANKYFQWFIPLSLLVAAHELHKIRINRLDFQWDL